MVETQEQSLADLGEIETLQARKNKLQENIRENKNKLTKLRVCPDVTLGKLSS